MRPLLPCLLLVACAPPPPVAFGETGAEAPRLEILYPEAGQQIELGADCLLTEPLIVHPIGVDLVPPADEDVEGQGHWHGGPSLENGYCVSSVAFCVGSDTSGLGTYLGAGLSAGLLTLYVELNTNTHEPVEGSRDQVEIELVDPGGLCP